MIKYDFESKDLNHNFLLYINKFVILSEDEQKFIAKLLQMTDAYIFGGVISNYFLSFPRKVPRDVDIVISKMNVKIERLLNRYLKKRNRFNGYEMKIGNMQYDIWKTEKTWTLYKNPILQKEGKELFLPETVFFNITSCIYDLNRKELLLHRRFKNGINNGEINIINEDNPYPELCVVKAMEYRETYKLRLADNLMWYILKHGKKISRSEYENAQISHYGYKKYSNAQINIFIINIEKYLGNPKSILNKNNQMELVRTKDFKKVKGKTVYNQY